MHLSNTKTKPALDEPIVVPPDQLDPTIKAIMDASKQSKEPPNVVVMLHNDDLTPYQLVVDILINVFGLTNETARKHMFTVHRTGRPLAIATLSEPVADTKLAQVQTLQGTYPLQFTKEPL